MDAILHVVRCFSGESVTHVDGSVDPVRDAGVIETELLLKDAETIDRALEKLRYGWCDDGRKRWVRLGSLYTT